MNDEIRIIPVTTKKGLKTFIQFHYDLYRDHKFAIPFLRFDEMNTLDPKKNPAFEFCEAQYFLAVDSEARIVGRIAGIINHRANEEWNKKQVRFGWFDFVDNVAVSCALLRAVEKWGKSRGMNECVGPLGFTDMDREGLLIEGFHHKSTMYINYNYPYYKNHMEAMSFYEKDNDWLEYRIKVPEETPAKFARTAEMIEKRYNLHVRKLTKKDVFQGGYGQKIFELINATYKDLYGYSELSQKQIDQLIHSYLSFLDFNLITCIEDWSEAEHKMVGIGITIPSLAKALQKCRRGRLFPFGWWHVLRAIKMHKTKIVDLLLVGVLPEYRAKGANALLFADLIPWYQKYGIEWGETQVELETNAGVQGQWGALTPVMHKRRKCYKKIIK